MYRFFALVLMGTASTVWAAEVPKVTIGGIINAQAGYTSQESALDTGTRHQGFRNDTEVHINVESDMPEWNMRYGATIELEADVTTDARAEGINADKTFIWAESDFGRFELGNNEGAETAMVVNAASIAKATGGIDGDDEFYINATGLTGTAAFLGHPDLPTADIGGIDEDATKISYYTPQFSGFQLGFSYAPDGGDGGQAVLRNDTNGNFENVFSAGIRYEGEWEQVTLAAAFVGEKGGSETTGTEGLNAWQLGADIGYKGFHFAGSYADWNDSGLATGASSSLETDFWTLGVSYDWEQWGASLTHLDSDRGGNEYKSTVLGAEYALAPGLTPYVDITFFEANESGVTSDNDGTVVLIGTYLNF